MSCTTCARAKPLPTCITNLTIGLVEPDTAYYVYIKRISNGTLKRAEATSDDDGLLIADISDLSEFLHTGSDFEMWITTQSAENINDKVSVTIGEEETDCLLLTFEKLVTSGYYGSGIDQTIML